MQRSKWKIRKLPDLFFICLDYGRVRPLGLTPKPHQHTYSTDSLSVGLSAYYKACVFIIYRGKKGETGKGK